MVCLNWLVVASEHTSTAGFTLPEDPLDYKQKVVIALKGGEIAQIACDVYMPAMGRYPNTANLGLVSAGVSLVERANTLSVEDGGYRCVGAPTVYGAGITHVINTMSCITHTCITTLSVRR